MFEKKIKDLWSDFKNLTSVYRWINDESLLTVNSNARISVFNTSMGVKVHDELDNEEQNQLFTLDINRKNKIFAVAG